MIDFETVKMSSQFVVIVRMVSDKASRPVTGWQLFLPTPMGEEPVLTARGNPKKCKSVEDALVWVRAHYKGYSVRLEMHPFFVGLLQPSFDSPDSGCLIV